MPDFLQPSFHFIQSPLGILATGILLVVGMIMVLRANAFFALLIAALTVSFLAGIPESAGGDWSLCITRVATAMGDFAGRVGVVIAMGAIIGNLMMLSGAADRIVLTICRLFGEKRVPAALLTSGFVLSIPVFYDTTLFLLIPLARSVYRRVKKNYILYLTAIGAGATLTHVLVPPTPGPLVIAQSLGVPLGMMMFVGFLVAACVAPFALLCAYFVNWYLPNPRILEAEEESLPDNHEELDRRLPSLGWSLLPLVLPVVLIAAQSIFAVYVPNRIARRGEELEFARQQAVLGAEEYERLSTLLTAKNESDLAKQRLLDVIGNPQIALTLAALCAMSLFLTRPGSDFRLLQEKVDHALMSAGVIVLITATGGAFGEMLRLAKVGDAIAELFQSEHGVISGSMMIVMAFCISALIKTAQGSSTTAMITTAGIVGAMGLNAEQLGFHMAYLAVVIGCGSIVVGWMNDSGFWAFCRMGRISETDAMKTWTVALGLIGLAGLAVVLVLCRLLPMTAL